MPFRLLFYRCAAPLMLIIVSGTYCAAASERSSVVDSLLELSDPLGSGWVLGDLDGDRETDIAVSREVRQSDSGYVYRVELKLSQSEGSGSFTFFNADDQGVNIAAADVDGDHDLDLVISGRFPDQRIGVWVNDGRGGFTQDLPHLFSLPDDWVLHSSRFNLPSQAIDQVALRLLPACFACARFIRAILFSVQAECSSAVQRKFRFENGPHHLRAPPNCCTSLAPHKKCLSGSAGY